MKHNAHAQRQYAVEAECDPRSIAKALRSGVDTIRVSATRERIRRVFVAHGIAPPMRDSSPPSTPDGGE